MQNSWHSKEEQQKSPILYLGIKTTVYPDVLTGSCVHILPYIGTEEKKSSSKKKRLFLPLVRHLMSKTDICSVSPPLTL